MDKKLKPLHQVLQENPEYTTKDNGTIEIKGCLPITCNTKSFFGTSLTTSRKTKTGKLLSRGLMWEPSWFEEN